MNGSSSPKLHGVNFRIAYIDLSRGSVEYIDTGVAGLSIFLGGRGLGGAYVYRLSAHLDPLDSGSAIAIMTGPLTGTGFPMANRLTFVFKSPLTGTIAWANTGGYAGSELKNAGFDGIVIVGRSRSPVYLLVRDGSIEIRDASDLWGLGAIETISLLRRVHGDSRVLAIGPAGENLVRFANVVNDTGRASGVRHGVGCVLGSKRVKAIVIPGGHRGGFSIADKAGRVRVIGSIMSKIRSSSLLDRERGLLAVHGTPIAVEALGANDAIPYMNYRYTRVDGYSAVGGRSMSSTILISRLTCSYCPVMCRRDTASAGRFSFRVEGPDYAQISSLGTNNALLDLEAIAYLNYLSYDLGLDPIEMGNILATLAEISEVAGLDRGEGLGWGDVSRMIELMEATARREDIGDLLAEGAPKLASSYGYPELSMSVKGVTIQNTDPRVEPAWGLINSVEGFGGAAHIWIYGDLIKSFTTLGVPQLIRDHGDPKEVAEKVAFKQAMVAVLDSLQVCAFSSYALDLDDYIAGLRVVNGLDLSRGELLDIGVRILDLERLFNERSGISPDSDSLPRRFLEEPVPSGRHRGRICDLEPMLSKYYSIRGLESGRLASSRRRDLESLAGEAVAL